MMIKPILKINKNEKIQQLHQLVKAKIIEVFENKGHVYFFLDRTLEHSIFDEIITLFKITEIQYIPLGIQKSFESSNLILIKIEDRKLLDKTISFLVDCFIKNYEPENDHYLVCGFGSSDLAIEDLTRDIKRKLVVKDDDRKIIFRWYDPRVMIYLEDIFEQGQLKNLYAHFSDWIFLHPTGLYFLDLNEALNVAGKPINKLTNKQSTQLDLISISNNVYQNLFSFQEEIDPYFVQPVNIHQSLFQAYDEYQIQETEHLISYGLYSQILHSNFMKYQSVIENLYQHCISGNKNFTEAMELLDSNIFAQIQQDYKNGV